MPRSPAVPVICACLFASFPHGLHAEENANRRAQVVLRVGDKGFTVGEIEDRIAEMPSFQRHEFGATPDEIRRAYVNNILIPDALWSAGAEKKQLGKRLPTSGEIERALSNAALRHVHDALVKPEGIPIAEVAAYYEQHREKFESPERIGIWRILCKAQSEAQEILSEVKKDPKPEVFTKLARDHSLDKATYLRGGNLGFVAADGTSNEAGLRVDPVIPKAAAAVKDGELVADPVPEDGNYAVIWRRGTLHAMNRTLNDAAPQIRQILFRNHAEDTGHKLLDDLRAKYVRDKHPELLEEVPVPEAEFTK